ncbi:MAG: hypothetical protein AB3X44_19685 [Leptothrix sp. (in: b-proteobacteria)]
MRGYVITSGLMFLVLSLIHVVRLLTDGTEPLANPIFIATMIFSTGMSAWAIRSLVVKPKQTRSDA